MRFLSLLLAFCLSLNAFADSSAAEKLEGLIDDYQYSLTVDWDQKDQDFYETQTKSFMQKMGKLMKEEDLKGEEILKLVEDKIQNKAALESLKTKLSLKAKKASPDEISEIIRESSKDLYSRGASWNGQQKLGNMMAAIVVTAIVFTAYYVKSHDNCSSGSSAGVCEI